jgi:hypothetical protein
MAVLSAPQAGLKELITLLLAAGADADRKNRHSRSSRELASDIRHGVEVAFTCRVVSR